MTDSAGKVILVDDAALRKVNLSWDNLDVYVSSRNGKKKSLLKGVSGNVSGGFCAIMGPSGSGKSTLLNTLACRLDRNTKMSGQTLLNGRPYDLAYLKRTSSYVMQDDVLNGQLTVLETMMYTAQLRLGPTPEEGLIEMVDKVIDQMGLTRSRDTVVGDPEVKGLSGGERKRLCVAMELLTDPTLLFLDEPTSGLDSVTALSLCHTLKNLADSGACTIMCTIHQPQTRIFNLFDKLILLKAGEIVYQGAAGGALAVYSKAGFPLPEATNPADHLLDIITPGMGGGLANGKGTGKQKVVPDNGVEMPELSQSKSNKEAGYGSEPAADAAELEAVDIRNTREILRVQARGADVGEREKPEEDHSMISRFNADDNDDNDEDSNRGTRGAAPAAPPTATTTLSESKDEYKSLLKQRDSVQWAHQFGTLLKRCLREQLRRKNTVFTQWVLALVMGLLVGGAFFHIGNDQKSLQKRQPLLFFSVINQGIAGSLAMLNSFPAERILSLRERKAGTYVASAYFLAKTSVESLTHIISPLLFSLAMYWMAGLQNQPGKFFVFVAFMMLGTMAATSVSLMVSTVCRTTTNSVAILPLFFEISRLFGGFFLSPKNLPQYFVWLDAMSYVKYAYVGISLNEETGLVLHCLPGQHNPLTGVCPITSGAQTIQNLGLDYISIGGCAGALLLFIFLTRGIAYLALRFIKW